MLHAIAPVPARQRFSLKPVIDLRSGLTAAFVLDPPADSPSGDLAATIAQAAAFVAQADFHGPLQVAPDSRSLAAADAPDQLAAAVRSAGLSPRRIDVLMDETALSARSYSDALGVLETYRAYGFGVCLVASARPHLPMSAQVRACLSDLRFDLSFEAQKGLRMDAAREAGIVISAIGEGALAALLRAGFDRLAKAA
jgi:predicted signal transduction protein with EAL and GGDEF domain